MRRRTFITGGFVTAAFLATGSGAYANLVERHAVEVRRVPLPLGLPRPLRLAVLADFHFDPFCELDYHAHVLDLVVAERPDLICLPGDFTTHRSDRFAAFTGLLPRLRPPLGTYAVLGNHDHWSGRHVVERDLAAGGVRLLTNQSLPLPGCPGWQLGGLDSYWAGHPDPRFLAYAPARDQFILMIHEPDPFDLVTDPRVRLQVSGHTHGGQVRAPLLGALRLPVWGKKYDAGLFRGHDDRHLYVTRGIGTVGPPVRFDCPPEITILELT
jgi:predicted MPP superfamily phosphohydrolase